MLYACRIVLLKGPRKAELRELDRWRGFISPKSGSCVIMKVEPAGQPETKDAAGTHCDARAELGRLAFNGCHSLKGLFWRF